MNAAFLGAWGRGLLVSLLLACSNASPALMAGGDLRPGSQSACEATPGGSSLRFAVIGDFGLAGQPEADVAARLATWMPDLVLTAGDDNYPAGAAATIDPNIGQYYHEFICPYSGAYGAGATYNRFLPALGNHDWGTENAQPYLDYFELPGNERYYDHVQGPVHFFIVDSDPHEPDGIDAASTQAAWLQAGLAASQSAWNIVLMHHAPYSSCSRHGSTITMQWPYAQWGADAVIAGHDHTYERLSIEGIPYFVNGLGGAARYTFGTPLAGSQVRYRDDHGAMLVEAEESSIRYKFINRQGALIDDHVITKPIPAAGVQPYPADGTSTCTRPAVGADLALTDATRDANGLFDPSTVQLNLDGADVTSAARIRVTQSLPNSHASIQYTPPSPLAIGRHLVTLVFATDGDPLTAAWDFHATSGTCTAAAQQPAPAEAGATGTQVPLVTSGTDRGASEPAEQLAGPATQESSPPVLPLSTSTIAPASTPTVPATLSPPGGSLGCLPSSHNCPRTIRLKH